MPKTDFPEITLTNKVPLQKIKDAKWLMSGKNKFQIITYRSRINGQRETDWKQAIVRAKELLGYPKNEQVPVFGNRMYRYLLGYDLLPKDFRERRARVLAEIKARKCYPLEKKGQVIGFPGIGTHSWWVRPNNWQSDNAVDILVPEGTHVIAYDDGVIDTQLGYGDFDVPQGSRFAGARLHLRTSNNYFYYTHLNKITVSRGDSIKKGQMIGLSGEANSVPHLHWACMYGNPENYLRNIKPC